MATIPPTASAGKNRRILLIAPAWLTSEALQAQVLAAQSEDADARLTLMSAPLARVEGVEWLAMPRLRSVPRAAAIAAVRALRRVRYDAAVVLADEARQEAGYFEAKLWAFLARARVRRLGKLRRLSLWEELADKGRRVLLQRILLRLFALYRDVKERPKRAALARLRTGTRQGASPVTACPVCGANVVGRFVPEAPDAYLRCPDCASLLLAWMPTPEALAHVYTSGYYTGEDRMGYEDYALREPKRRLEAFVYHNRHDRLFGKERGNYLDVGCALGQYLDVAQERGWNTHGSEFSAWASERARARGHTIWQGDFLELNGSERFRFITLVDVIEHMKEAFAPFEKAAALLEPGGAALIRVPDACDLVGGRHHLDDVTHLWFPSENALRLLAERAGLIVEEIQISRFDGGALDAWLRKPVRAEDQRSEGVAK